MCVCARADVVGVGVCFCLYLLLQWGLSAIPFPAFWKGWPEVWPPEQSTKEFLKAAQGRGGVQKLEKTG